MLKVQTMCQVRSLNVQILSKVVTRSHLGWCSADFVFLWMFAGRLPCHMLINSLTAWGQTLFNRLVALVWMSFYLLPGFMRQNTLWDGWEGSLTILEALVINIQLCLTLLTVKASIFCICRASNYAKVDFTSKVTHLHVLANNLFTKLSFILQRCVDTSEYEFSPISADGIGLGHLCGEKSS